MMNKTTEDVLDEFISRHVGEWFSSREAAWYAKCTTKKAGNYILERFPNVERYTHQTSAESISMFKINGDK